MGTTKNIEVSAGKKFGRLTVIGLVPRSETPAFVKHVYVKCECGKEKCVRVQNLKGGRTKSCGCLHREIVSVQRSRKEFATKEWLSQKYIQEQLSIEAITKLLGLKHTTAVKNWMVEAGIPLRTIKERQKLIQYVADESHPNYKNGKHCKSKNKSYYLVCVPAGDREKHRCDKYGACPEHVFVFENYLGRRLAANELVHHVNYNKTDNRLENLILLPSHKAHRGLHFHLENLGAFYCGLIEAEPSYTFPKGTVAPPGAKIPIGCAFEDSAMAEAA